MKSRSVVIEMMDTTSTTKEAAAQQPTDSSDGHLGRRLPLGVEAPWPSSSLELVMIWKSFSPFLRLPRGGNFFVVGG
jgi:hypothetical protein